jgi:chaperone modulatory protein CbpM
MMDIETLVASIPQLQRADLESWVSAELVMPGKVGPVARFTEMECARVRLICTLHYDLEIGADTLPLVLSLIDQLYASRQRLASLATAIAQQEPSVRERILAALPPGS